MNLAKQPIINYIVVVLFLLSFVGCSDLPTGPADSSGMRVKGVTLADWTPNGYAAPAASAAVDAVAALGANRLVIVVTAYQSGLGDSAVRADPQRTPDEGAVRLAAERARGAGMDVVIKLHVDVDSGEWRGHIRPSDVVAWFASYGAWVEEWSNVAAEVGAAQLVVGTELAGTVAHAKRWRALFARARSRFPGEVVYAASWDEAWMVPFWDAVDRVGVDFYAAVAVRANAGRVEILAGWQPWIERLHVLHGQTGKPLLLTEIGYRSVDGAGMYPYDFTREAGYDGGEQADLYWAALEAVAATDWIEGVYWWNWPASGGGGTTNTDYTPEGKPAAGELRGAWNG